jgi:hypothetical protein
VSDFADNSSHIPPIRIDVWCKLLHQILLLVLVHAEIISSCFRIQNPADEGLTNTAPKVEDDPMPQSRIMDLILLVMEHHKRKVHAGRVDRGHQKPW